MRSIRPALLSVLLASSLLVACSQPSLGDFEGRSFSSVRDFTESVTCSQYFEVFVDSSGQPPVIQDEDEAVAMATSVLDASMPRVSSAQRAGDVWLLVDVEGIVFAAMDSVGDSIGGCLK